MKLKRIIAMIIKIFPKSFQDYFFIKIYEEVYDVKILS